MKSIQPYFPLFLVFAGMMQITSHTLTIIPMKKQHPNENEYGYRYCALCDQWLEKIDFALSALSHDGMHPLCKRHVGQREADARAEVVAELLRAAKVSPACPLDYIPAPSVVEQATGKTPSPKIP